VVLLALLVPAMDTAVYQAELTVCAGNVKGFAQGLTTYAFDHKRHYPLRIVAGHTQPHDLADPNPTQPIQDNRPFLRPYVPIQTFEDPLTPQITYDDLPQDTQIHAPYKLWYNWRFPGGTRSNRIGSPFSWRDRAYTVLVADYDEYQQGFLTSNHPDRAGTMAPQKFDAVDASQDPLVPLYTGGNTVLSLARWLDTPAFDRTGLDLNFAYQDASVRRLSDLAINDAQRTEKVPNRYNDTDDSAWYNRLPLD